MTTTGGRRGIFLIAAMFITVSATTGCGHDAVDATNQTRAASAMPGSRTSTPGGADLPAFTGTIRAGFWTSAQTELVEATFEMDYRSNREWTKTATWVSRDDVELTIERFSGGVHAVGPIGSDWPIETTDDGPVAPDSWLHTFDLTALAKLPNWAMRELPNDRVELVETLELGCDPAWSREGTEGPSIRVCPERQQTITETSTYVVDPSGFPMSFENRFEGQLVGFARFERLTLG